jgi:hypothetical protein
VTLSVQKYHVFCHILQRQNYSFIKQRAHNVLHIPIKAKDPKKIILKPKRMIETLGGRFYQKIAAEKRKFFDHLDMSEIFANIERMKSSNFSEFFKILGVSKKIIKILHLARKNRELPFCFTTSNIQMGSSWHFILGICKLKLNNIV